MLTLTVTGKPIAQARPRFVRRGKFVSTYNPQETEAGKFALSVMAQLPEGFKPFNGPLAMSCLFCLPIPKSSEKKRRAMLAGEILHTKRPDCSNYLKFIEDCMNGVVWLDDSQIVQISAEKCYAEIPRTVIVIKELSNNQNGGPPNG